MTRDEKQLVAGTVLLSLAVLAGCALIHCKPASPPPADSGQWQTATLPAGFDAGCGALNPDQCAAKGQLEDLKRNAP